MNQAKRKARAKVKAKQNRIKRDKRRQINKHKRRQELAAMLGAIAAGIMPN